MRCPLREGWIEQPHEEATMGGGRVGGARAGGWDAGDGGDAADANPWFMAEHDDGDGALMKSRSPMPSMW